MRSGFYANQSKHPSPAQKVFPHQNYFPEIAKSFVAEIFQQQKTVFVVACENFRRAETEFSQMHGDLHEWCDDFTSARSVHQNRGFISISQAKIFSCGSVAGQRLKCCRLPFCNFEKFWRQIHLSSSRCQFINSGACLSQSRDKSPSVALLAMSVGSMPSLCACASRIFSNSRKRRNSASLGRWNLCRKISGCLSGGNGKSGSDGFQQSFAAARTTSSAAECFQTAVARRRHRQYPPSVRGSKQKTAGGNTAMASFSRHCQNSRKMASAGRFKIELPFTRQTESASTVGGLRTFLDQSRAGFLMPREPVFGFELGFQFVRERLQIMRVVARINFHFFRQRPPRPIGFLRAFVQFHAEKFFHERNSSQTAVRPATARQASCRKSRTA